MNPIPKHPPLITAERVQTSIRGRFNPIPLLTPARIAAWLESFRLGFFRNLALAWDTIERRDYTLAAVASKRKKAVARHGWEILTINNSPAAQQQKLALEYFYNHLTVTTALEENETGGLALLIRQMMDAVGKRYAVHEIIWQPGQVGHKPAGSASDLPFGLTAAFRFCPLWWFEGTQGRLRFLSSEFAIYGADLEPGGWLVTVGDGIMEACSVAFVFKLLTLRDWVSYCEKFGTPGILGLTDAPLDSPDWNELTRALENFSQDWTAVCSKQNSIELLEPKGRGEDPFAPLVESMDRAITTLWRGADLGTISSRNAAGASLQADESEILEADDAQMIGETLTAQVSRRVLQYYFGDAPQLAYIKIRTSEKRDISQDLKTDDFLLRAGFPISIASAGERYDRAVPAPEEPCLVAPATPPLTTDSNPETVMTNSRIQHDPSK